MLTQPEERAFCANTDPLDLLTSLESTTVRKVAHDAARQILRVEFRSDATYEYYGVPGWLYALLIEAQPHPWAHAGALIRAYPFRRLFRPEGLQPTVVGRRTPTRGK